MRVDTKEVIRSMLGTSELADSLVDRLSKYEEEHTLEGTSSSIDEEEVDSTISEILENAELGERGAPVAKISSIIVYLLNVIEGLRLEVEELTSRLEENPNAPLLSDDEAIDKFKKNFMLSLSERKVGELKLFYTKSNLEKLKPQTRKTVVDCLIKFSLDRGKTPAKVWEQLSTNNGNMQ